MENKPETVEYDGKTPLKGKREKFAQLIASNTKNQTEAHKQAGYKEWKGSGRYAHDLAHNPIIMARIAYLRAELAKKWDITRESQTQQYIDIRDRAMASGDIKAEISANNSIDKLCGLIVDKKQTIQSGAQKARTVTEERIYREFSDWQLHRKLGLPGGLREHEITNNNKVD